MSWIHCDKCKKWIVKRSNSHKYCKSCAIEVKIASRKKSREITLGPHMKRKTDGTPDFKAERKAIVKEMKKLGLRK